MPFPLAYRVLVGFLLTATSAFGGEYDAVVTLRATLRGGGAVPPEVTLRMQSNTDAREVVLQHGLVTISAAAGSEWTLSSAASELWTLPQHITFPASGTRLEARLELWPAAQVTGMVSAGETSRPDVVTLSFESPPRPAVQPDIPRGTIATCPLTASGRWTCVVPAAKLDLVVRVKGMTPQYVWDVAVAPAQVKDLGTFRLRPGASFVAYLDRRIAESAKTRARLVRPVAQVASETAARLSVPVAEGSFDKRGWLQLAPVPAGSYVLEVEAEGFARTEIAPIEIYEGKESAFRKLIELAPPVHLTVAIDPPTDVDGSLWNVTAAAIGDLAPAAGVDVRTRADAAGIATIKDQAPGLFLITIADADRQTIWSRDVRITGGSDSRIPVALDLKAVAGRVTLAEKPVPAVLWFGRRDGAVRIRMEADANGRFRGRLPRSGVWPVEIVCTAPRIRTIIDAEVVAGTELRLSVPNTSLSGRVVSESGERLARAAVSVMSGTHAFEALADTNGEFEFHGLPAGPVRLLATNRTTGASSAAFTTHLQERTHHDGVELRITPVRKIAGTVVSGGQPVVGARVAVTAIDVHSMTREAVSDLSGNFSVSVPAAARRAQFIVSAPNRTLQPFELVLADGPIVLAVAPVGGTLEIAAATTAGPGLVIRHNGAYLPLQAVFAWLSAHGHAVTHDADLTVPDLAPGHYQVCADNGCSDGMLAPRGSLRLKAGR